MPWWKRQPKYLILNRGLLKPEELAGALAWPEHDIKVIAILQIIDELEREASQSAQATVANHGISASCNGGAEFMSRFRDQFLGLREKGWGTLESERNKQ